MGPEKVQTNNLSAIVYPKADLVVNIYKNITNPIVRRTLLNSLAEKLDPQIQETANKRFREDMKYQHAVLFGKGRAHALGKGQVDVNKLAPKKHEALEDHYKSLKGDILKTRILEDFKHQFENFKGNENQKIQFVRQFVNSPKYDLLAESQGLGIKAKFGIKTDSIKILDEIVQQGGFEIAGKDVVTSGASVNRQKI